MLYRLHQYYRTPIEEYRKHDILEIWNRVLLLWKKLPEEEVGELEDATVLKIVGDRLKEFHILDTDSTTFRYPSKIETKKGADLNLKHVKDIINELSKFLDKYTMGLAGFLEDRDANEADMRSEYEYE